MTSKDFTLTDLIVLWVLDPRYRYMTRDRNGMLCVYEFEPVKYMEEWMPRFDHVGDNTAYEMMGGLDKECLSAISWDDDRPFVIPPREVIANIISNIMYDKLLTGEFNTKKGWFL